MFLVSAPMPQRSPRTIFRPIIVDLNWLRARVGDNTPWVNASTSYRWKILEIDTGETQVDFLDIILLAFEIGAELKNCTLEIDETTETLVLGIHRPPIPWRPVRHK